MDGWTGSVAGTLLRLTVTVLAAGALLAGVLLPWVGVPAVAAQGGTGLLGAPPVELTDQPPPGNTVLLARNGEPITWFYDENRAPVASEQIAPVMKQAMTPSRTLASTSTTAWTCRVRPAPC